MTYPSFTGVRGPLPLFSDREEIVNAHDIALTARVVRCPVCKEPAPRVFVGCGVDVHLCACGAWLNRWWCCGAVAVRADDAGYRTGGDCPGCGRSRWERAEEVSMAGTVARGLLGIDVPDGEE